jgi:hypothetical protein
MACADDLRRDDTLGYSGAARRIADEQVQRVLVMTLELRSPSALGHLTVGRRGAGSAYVGFARSR